MDPQIQEKLNLLRSNLKRDEAHSDAIKQVAQWEEDLHTIFDKEKYREHSITQFIVRDAKKQIVDINLRLLSNSRITTEDRDALIAERKGYEWYLRLIDKDWKKEAKAIEESIDYELE